LDYSKIEAARSTLEHRPFALTALIEDITELLAPRAQARKLEIAAYVDEPAGGRSGRRRRKAAPGAAQSRRQRHQVHRDPGGVALIVEPGIRSGEISFLVRDSGIGIAPEASTRIFCEFEAGGRRQPPPLRRYRPRAQHL